MTTTISTVRRFEAGHRQYGDPGKCGSLHGHNWVAEFTVTGDVTDELGYLINFSVFKDIVERYDHAMIMDESDPLADVLEEQHQKVVRLPLNPTCEGLAQVILTDLLVYIRQHNLQIQCVVITVYENEDSFATEIWTEGGTLLAPCQ